MEISNAAQPATVKEVTLDTFEIKIKGHQYISKKLFEVMAHILIDQEVSEFKCINEIVFSPDEPVGKFGVFDTETLSITINLQRNFNFATDVVKDVVTSTLALRCHLWYNLMSTLVHEILHAMAFKIDPDKMIGEDREVVEKDIVKETKIFLKELIRDYDVEPPSMDDEPYFGSRYMEFYIKNIKEGAEQWAINQAAVHDNNAIWKDDECVCATFREWYHLAYQLEKDTSWDKEVGKLETVEVVMEEKPPAPDAVMVVNEPVISTFVNVLPDTPDAVDTPDVKEQLAKSTAEYPSQTCKCGKAIAGGNHIGKACPFCGEEIEGSAEVVNSSPNAMDPEMMALLDMEETPEANMEEGELQLDPVALAFSGVQKPVETTSVVEKPVETTTTLPDKHAACIECGAVLGEDAKFCSSCGISTEITPRPNLEAGPAAPVQGTGIIYNQESTQYSQGAKRPMRHDLPNYNHSPDQIRACVGEVFIRCYQHIFGKCGFSPGQNPSFAPELRNAITEPVSVVGIPCINEILIGMDSIDPLNGTFTWRVPAVNNMIRGKVTKKQNIPSYTLYFNFCGHEAKRLILPQNQWKAGVNGYSIPAQKAQQGATIIWMIDGDDSTPGQKLRAKINSGMLEWLI